MSNMFTPEQIELLRVEYKDAPKHDFKLFLEVCNATQLDPFTKQIYLMNRSGKWRPETSINGFRIAAIRTGRFEGQTGPFWCGADGVWKDVWLEKTPPVAAKVGVWGTNFKEPTTCVARTEAFKGAGPFWVKMADHMIAKVAEALALRRAFPQELSGLYTSDEMDQAGAAVEPKKLAHLAAVSAELTARSNVPDHYDTMPEHANDFDAVVPKRSVKATSKLAELAQARIGTKSNTAFGDSIAVAIAEFEPKDVELVTEDSGHIRILADLERANTNDDLTAWWTNNEKEILALAESKRDALRHTYGRKAAKIASQPKRVSARRVVNGGTNE